MGWGSWTYRSIDLVGPKGIEGLALDSRTPADDSISSDINNEGGKWSEIYSVRREGSHDLFHFPSLCLHNILANLSSQPNRSPVSAANRRRSRFDFFLELFLSPPPPAPQIPFNSCPCPSLTRHVLRLSAKTKKQDEAT